MEKDELREKIDLIFDGCYSQERSTCHNHTIFQRGKAVNEILPLIEEAEHEEGKRIIDVMNAISAWTIETRQYRDMIIEEILKEKK